MQWYHRYALGLKQRPSSNMLVGKSGHASAEADLIEKRATGALLPPDAVTDIARDRLVSEWSDSEVELTPEERDIGPDAARGSAIDKVTLVAGMHHESIAPRIDPVHIEREWVLSVTGWPFEITGFIDVQEADRIRDYKITSKSPGADTANTSLQLTMYSMAATALDGKTPSELVLDHVVTLKAPKVVTQTTSRSNIDHEQMLDRIAAMHFAIEAGVFCPTDPSNWVCSDRWCGYWNDHCPYGRRGRVLK